MVWKRSQARGVLFTQHPVIFTSDNRFIVGCAGNGIKIYGVQSGEEVRSLYDHNAEVTSICFHPKNPSLLFSASLDGCIKLWHIEYSTVQETFSVGLPITHMQIGTEGDIAYVVTENVKEDKKTEYNLWGIDFATSQKRSLHSSEYRFSGIAVSATGNTLVASSGHWILSWKTKEDHRRELICTNHHMRFSCIAIHPQDEFIATGDAKGEVTIWYHKASKAGGKIKKKSFLWHTKAPKALAFTADGVYLLSGGAEEVLVSWQLETGIKQFLPGLGSKFTGISVSPDSTYYCCALQDNSVKIINAVSSSMEKSIQGFKKAKTEWQYPHIAIEPRNHLMVTNSLLGSIQFFNPLTDRFSFELMIELPSAENVKDSISSRIAYFAFSKEGTHLATVEVKGGQTSLKFWFYRPQENQWMLNTSVDGPHQDSMVTSLSCHPDVDMFVTTAMDGKFKMWTKINLNSGQASHERKRVMGQNHSWVCRSVGFHAKQKVTCSAFSDDGSILAIGYEDTLTLWNPQKNTLLHELPHTPNDTIKKVVFIANSPFVVTCTNNFMYVWNLLTSCVWWSYRANVSSIAAEPNSSRFVVSVTEKDHHLLLLFKCDSPVPLHSWRLAEPPAAVAFFSKVALDAHQSSANSTIVYVNKSNNVHVIEEYTFEALSQIRESSYETPMRQPLGEDEVNLYERLYGSQTPKKRGGKLPFKAAPSESHRALALLNAPSHILPPMSSLYSSFMEILVKKIQPVEEKPTKIETEVKTETPKLKHEIETGPSLAPNELKGLDNKLIDDMSLFFKKNLKISVENGRASKKTPRKAERMEEESQDVERSTKKTRPIPETNGGNHVTVEEMLAEEEAEEHEKQTPRRSSRKVANGKSAKKEANGNASPKQSQEEQTSPEPLAHRKRKLKPESKQNES